MNNTGESTHIHLESSNEEESRSLFQFISFKCGQTTYGLPLFGTREIVHVPHLTFLPAAPSFVRGIFNWRGHIVCVIDLLEWLGLSGKETQNLNPKKCVIVMNTPKEGIGLIADGLNGIVTIPSSRLESAPEALGSASRKTVSSIARYRDQIIPLLNLESFSSLGIT